MMISKNPVSEISVSLSTFRQAVDEILEDFDRQGAIDHASVIKHRGEWTEEFMRKSLDELREKNLNNLRPKYDRARKKASDDCAFYLATLKTRFDQYFTAGVRPEFASKLEAYKTMDVIPSKIEIQLLCDDAVTYAERQILKAYLLRLGESRVTTDENGNIDRSKTPLIDLTDYERYGLDSVDIDSAYEALDLFRDSVVLMLEHYCAGSERIYPLTGHEVERDSGNDTKTLTGEFIFQGVNASSYFDNQKDIEIREQIDKLNGLTMRKHELSASEKELLSTLFDAIPERVKGEAVKSVHDTYPQIGCLLEVSNVYSKYLE